MNSIDIVSEAARKDKLSHAYLAPVRSGTNLKSYAVEIGQKILCSRDDKKCPEKVIRNTHPDFIMVEVMNGKSKISINQVEDIISGSAYSAVEGDRKLYVINRVEDLSREGANSLLKILEDPPNFVYFLLLTESPNSLLPTIISRCQQLPRGGTSIEGMKDLLSGEGFTEDEVEYLIDVVNRKATLLEDLLEGQIDEPLQKKEKLLEDSESSDLVELSCSLRESESFIEKDVLARLIFEKMDEASNLELIAAAEELAKTSQAELEWFLEKGLEVYRKNYKSGLRNSNFTAKTGQKRLKKIRVLDHSLESLGSNANVQLLLESTLVSLARNPKAFFARNGL